MRLIFLNAFISGIILTSFNTMNNTINITDNTDELRFETPVGDKVAFIAYRWEHGKLALMHTEVPQALAGKGIASTLAKYAFKWANEQNKKVIVYCPFVAAYLKRHPEYNTLIDKDHAHNE